jgi:hypothetical protein
MCYVGHVARELPWEARYRLRPHDKRRELKEEHVPILIFMLLINRAHQSGSRRQHLIDEDEDGLLGRQLDALADYVDELAYGQVGGDKIFLLVDGRDVAFFDFLADNRDAVGIFLSLEYEVRCC